MKNKNNLPVKKEKGLWESIKIKLNKIIYFFKNKKEGIKEKEDKEHKSQDNETFTQLKETVIDKAKIAYKNYILKSDPDIIIDTYNLIKERIIANKDNIISLLKIENSNIDFNDILEILNNEKNNIKNFKKSIHTEKLDNKFIYSEYQVPVRSNWNDIK